jgi:pilus assembly protein CpaF
VLEPIASNGALVSFRIPKKSFMSFEYLTKIGTIPPPMVKKVLDILVSKKSILISGGTGSGKTTLLAGLITEIPQTERIICIEEIAELPESAHKGLVFLRSRKNNVEGAGSVSLAELMRASLRMRPDRIILGECRGDEIRELFQSMNTGHSGSMCTIHANSIWDIPARLEALGSSSDIGIHSITKQAISAIDYVFQMKRIKKNRILCQIGEIDKHCSEKLKIDLISEV